MCHTSISQSKLFLVVNDIMKNIAEVKTGVKVHEKIVRNHE